METTPLNSAAFTLEDLQRVGPEVLARLKGMATLPPGGTVAGQAVASLFYEALGLPVRGPINDIDVFVNLGMPRELRGRAKKAKPDPKSSKERAKLVRTNINSDHPQTDTHDYGRIKFIAMRATTVICSTYQEGLVNYTLITSPLIKGDALGHGIEVSQSLIDGFDLNLVQVGINLDDGHVVASQAFLDFLSDQTIRVVNANTPAHTLIRLAAKCHGGQLLGAKCDFLTERAMLETALACQGNGVLAGTTPHYGMTGNNLHTILHFGGSKYKKLHKKFSQHLPPVREHKVEGDEDYRLYSLDTQTPETEIDSNLAAWGQDRKLFPTTLAHSLFVSHFPDIYDLFHPERCILPEAHRLERLQHFQSLVAQRAQWVDDHESGGDTNMTPSDFLLGQAALGHTTQLEAKDRLHNLDEEDAAVFFFGQASGTTTAGIESACEAWNRLDFVEQHLVHNLDMRADQVLAFSQNKKATIAQTFRNLGGRPFNIISSFIQRPNLEEDEELRAGRLAFLMLRTLVNLDGEQGRVIRKQIYHQLMPVGQVNGVEPGLIWGVGGALNAQQRKEFAGIIMADVNPSWPAMRNANTLDRVTAMVQWWAADQDIPQAFWDHVKPEDVREMTERVLLLMGNWHYRYQADKHKAALRVLGALLTPEDVAYEQGMLLRGALQLDVVDVLDLSRMMDEPRMEEVARKVIGLHQEQINKNIKQGNMMTMFDDNEAFPGDNWGLSPNPERDIAALEAMLMQHKTAAAPTARRKPGGRL